MNSATLIKEQDYKVLGGPLEAPIAGGGGAYAPDPTNSNQANSVFLPPYSVWMVVRKAVHILDAGGSEFARARLVDGAGKAYDSVLGKGSGQTIEQSEGEPLANVIEGGENGLTLSIAIDQATPDPVSVAASFTLKAVIPNPTRFPIKHSG